MSKTRWSQAFATIVLILSLLSATMVTSAAPVGQDPTPQRAPVEPELQLALETKEQVNLFVMFDGQADLIPAYAMSWEERGEFVYETLKEAAEHSQAQVRAFLDANNIPYRAFITDNSIYIAGADSGLVDELATFSQVSLLRLEQVLPVPDVKIESDPIQPLAVEWGVAKINADDVWGLGYTGQGIVVASIDTGVRYTHNALQNQYRGNHTYSWYDPTGTYPSAPGDNNGHGTHTMGTMIGDDGGSNQIGVAPGAKWIACKGCTSSSCYQSDLNACADWMLAPGGSTSMRPNVVNNSWGGCSYSDWYRSKVSAWRAAGIYPVFSNGNTSNCGYSAPFCGSVGTPATYKEATGVGATTSSDGIANFSLWGPSQDPTAPNEIKPEVSAPGASVRSSYNSSNSSYATMSGTSMAAPHVSGALALIWSACPALLGDVSGSEQLLKDSAYKIAYATGCGNEGPGNIPNNAFGYGRIDVLAAVNACSAGPAGLTYGKTPDAVTHNWYSVGFSSPLGSAPALVASMQTFDGSNAAGLRIRNLTSNDFQVFVEEEKSLDSEIDHVTEVVGYIAAEAGLIKNSSGGVIGEAGRLNKNQSDGSTWYTINLQRTYNNPVVLMHIDTFNGAHPTHMRLRNVGSNSFQYQQEEWDYLDQSHTTETLGYVVLEAGTHQLAGGVKVRAGTTQTDHSWKTVSLSGFSSAPVVVSLSQTYNGGQAVVTRQRNVGAGSFQVRLQEEEGNDGSHLVETIGYVAIGQ